MKNWYIYPLLLFVLAFGFVFLRTMSSFFVRNLLSADEEPEWAPQKKIRISAEKVEYLDDIAATLSDCANTMPGFSYRLCGTSRASILQKLHKGSTDIALLEALPDEKCYDTAPLHHAAAECYSVYGLPISSEASAFYIVWDPSVSSKDRDYVLQFIQRQSTHPIQIKKL